MNDYNVIIAGARIFTDVNKLFEICDKALANIKLKRNICIISGNANGADKLGEFYASSRGYNIKVMPADWNKHGNKAGYMRNVEMSEVANACIIFLKGESKGSKHMIQIAKSKKLPCVIYDSGVQKCYKV